MEEHEEGQTPLGQGRDASWHPHHLARLRQLERALLLACINTSAWRLQGAWK